MSDTTTGTPEPTLTASQIAARQAQEQRARVAAENAARRQAQLDAAAAKKAAQAEAQAQAVAANQAAQAQKKAQTASGSKTATAAYSSVKSGSLDLPEKPPVIETVADTLETPGDVTDAASTPFLYIALAGLAALLIFGKGFKNGR